MSTSLWKPELVLSAREIEGLDARLERCARLGLAEQNHRRHRAWYKRWLAQEQGTSEARRVHGRLVTAAVRAGNGTVGEAFLLKEEWE